MDDLSKLQNLVRDCEKLTIDSGLYNASKIVQYHPEELVITVTSGTKISQIQTELEKNQQSLSFYIENPNKTIGSVFATGGTDLADSVLGVQIIDGRGEVLNFGGQVMKNVAGYDVARLLVGSKGQLAIVTQISFKVVPSSYINKLSKPKKVKNKSPVRQKIEERLKLVFDPEGKFA